MTGKHDRIDTGVVRKNAGFTMVEVVVVICVVGIIGAVGYVWWQGRQTALTSQHNPTSRAKTSENIKATPAPIIATDYSGWKLYTSIACKFSFRYPGSAEIGYVAQLRANPPTCLDDGVVISHNVQITGPDGTDGQKLDFGEDGYNIYFEILENQKDLSLDDFVTDLMGSPGNINYTSPENISKVTAGGKPAIFAKWVNRVTGLVEPVSQSGQYFILVDGNKFILNISYNNYSKENFPQKIIESLQLK